METETESRLRALRFARARLIWQLALPAVASILYFLVGLALGERRHALFFALLVAAPLTVLAYCFFLIANLAVAVSFVRRFGWAFVPAAL